MRKLTQEEQKKIQLEILDDIHRFCSDKGILYSLCGGSVIGAVRHGGYIPWDDDIDLMMPRTDYERFISEYDSQVNEVTDLSRRDDCVEQFIKVSRIGTRMRNKLTHSCLWGVNVDIFPIDGMPQDYKPYTDELVSLHNVVITSCPHYKAAHRKKAYWFLRYILKRLTRNDFRDVLEVKGILNSMALEHLPENNPLSTVIFGDFKIFPFPTELFYDIGEILFEGKRFRCIRNTDLYLRKVYGNYMELPPEDKRVSHHHFESFIDE